MLRIYKSLYPLRDDLAKTSSVLRTEMQALAADVNAVDITATVTGSCSLLLSP